MPVADLPVHNNLVLRSTSINGIAIRNDVLFTNAQGQEDRRIQQRKEKMLQKLLPALQRVLLPEEAVLCMTSARSPLSPLEQLTASIWLSILAACTIVFTDKRVLFFPVKSGGGWRESVRAVSWGDLEEVKPKGALAKVVTFKFKNGTKTTYTAIPRAEAQKIAAVAQSLLPASAGQITSTQGLVQLCPDCRAVLTPGQYLCPACGLTFKNEKTMMIRSILIPAGGYFYTGHSLIGILPAIVEVFLLVDILVVLFAGQTAPEEKSALLSGLVVLAVFWAIESAVTILHCRRFVREFIPEKRDPLRAH